MPILSTWNWPRHTRVSGWGSRHGSGRRAMQYCLVPAVSGPLPDLIASAAFGARIATVGKNGCSPVHPPGRHSLHHGEPSGPHSTLDRPWKANDFRTQDGSVSLSVEDTRLGRLSLRCPRRTLWPPVRGDGPGARARGAIEVRSSTELRIPGNPVVKRCLAHSEWPHTPPNRSQ